MRDESYEAGYRAGHLQGWLDATAKMAAKTRREAHREAVEPTPPAPVPPVQRQKVPAAPQGKPALQPRPLAPPAARQWHVAGTPLPKETPEERQARKARRDRQNINITLYVASLLLVAAAALFVGTALPPVLRFAGVCTVAALFYGSGLGVHRKVPRLRPASVAFTGTGLALVPVIGLALYNFAWHSASGAWLVTSLVGTVAYIAAALRLESKVLVYLSLTFVVSTAWSGIAVLGAALVWYFVALIGVAALLTLLSLLAPGWLPPVFARPLMTLHPLVVPGVAAAVTFFPVLLTPREYVLIIALSGGYFALVAAVRTAPFRVRNFYGARASFTVAAAVATWELTGHAGDALAVAAGLLALQAAAAAFGFGVLEAWFPPAASSKPGAVRQQEKSDADTGADPGRWRLDVLLTLVAQFGVTAACAGMAVLDIGSTIFPVADGQVPLWQPLLMLLFTTFVVAARLNGLAEAAPHSALALAWLASPAMGEMELAVMLVLAMVAWLVRGGRAQGARRRVLLFNARAAATAAVPATAAAMTVGTVQAQAVWASLAAAAVVQQLLSVVLHRAGRATLAPQATLAAYAGLGVGAVAVLAAVDVTPHNGLALVCILGQLAAAAVVGLLLVPRTMGAGTWQPSAGEVLPLVVSALMVELAFRGVSLAAGNTALALVLAYLAVTGLRLPARLHRWGYWWLARVAGTLVVLTGFEQLTRTAGTPVIGGEALLPVTVFNTALILQMALVLGSYVLHRAPRGIVADSGIIILLQLMACSFLVPVQEGNLQGLLVSAAALLSAAFAGYVLRRERGSAWFVPPSFVVLVVLSLGNLLLSEVLLALAALFAVIMAAAAVQAVHKGWYFVAARVLTAALAVVLSHDVMASAAAVSVTFAVVLTAQHGVRWVMRFRLQEVPFQQAAVWITLGGQALLPLAYALENAGSIDAGVRGVLLFELALLLVCAGVARGLFAARGALYFGVYALLFAVLTLSPALGRGGGALLSYTGTAAMLLLLGLLAVGAGVLWDRKFGAPQGAERLLWLAAAGAFVVAALVLAPAADEWVAGAAVLAIATVLFVASHVERIPVLYLPAVVATLTGTYQLAEAALGNTGGAWGTYLPWLAGPGLAAGVLYMARQAAAGKLVHDPVRRWSLAGSSFLGLGAAAVAGLPADATSWAAACLAMGAAGVALLEAPAAVRRVVAELGVLTVVAAVQRAAIFDVDAVRTAGGTGVVVISAGLPDPFWVAQWYVVLGGLVAALRYRSGHRRAGRAITGAVATLLTLTGISVVFTGGGGQQLWLLVMLAVLLAGGLVLVDRMFVRWGAAGIAVCILWAMREYTFALLAIIAVGLIAFAVWRLNRTAGPERAAGGDAPARNVP